MAHSHSGARTGEGSGTLILVWSNPSSPSPLRRRLVRHHHQRPAVVGRQHEHGRQDLCRLHRFDPQAHLGARRLPGHGWQALPGQLAARTPPPRSPRLPLSHCMPLQRGSYMPPPRALSPHSCAPLPLPCPGPSLPLSAGATTPPLQAVVPLHLMPPPTHLSCALVCPVLCPLSGPSPWHE